MPLELTPHLDMGKRILRPGDRGFLIGAKPRYLKNLTSHAFKWLNHYTQRYFEARCPEEAAALKAADEQAAKEEEEEKTNGEVKEEVKEEPMEEGKEEDQQEKKEGEEESKTEEKEAEKEGKKEEIKKKEVNHSGIMFVERESIYDACCFIATNLVDPSDYLHFVFYTMAECYKTEKKTKFPLRVMPVNSVCEARGKSLETAALPLMEKVFGQSIDPVRFSITYKATMDGEHLAQRDAGTIVRNCIWSVNPSCVQCIKYQDYAILLDILDPLICIGVAKDFNKLGGYNTAGVRHGLDLQDEHTDSEDDISDDPTLDEEENKRMKLRIKRKRRAAKAGLSQYNGNAKKSQEDGEEEEEGGEEEEEEGNEEEHGEEEEGGNENGGDE